MENSALDLDYNSSRDKLVIPEYGRHVQNLIAHAKTIADKQERQDFVEGIVNLIHQMNPFFRNIDEYRSKLWVHVMKISDYELDVESPYGPITKEAFEPEKAEPLPYPASNPKLKHYGYHVEQLIMQACEMEEGEKRDSLVQIIGSYMKLAYRTWSQDQYISDEVIKSDLNNLSKGKLTLDAETSIDKLANSTRSTSHSRRNPKRSSNHRRSGGSNRGGSNRGGSNRGGSNRGGPKGGGRRRR